MNRFKKLLSLLLVVCMVLSIAAMVTGCKTEKNPSSGGTTENAGGDATTGNVSGESKPYTVKVSSKGGMAMEGLSVYVYANSDLADLKDYGETDAEGNVTFDLPASSDYAVEIQGAPEGYTVEKYYTFSGNAAEVRLESSLIMDESLTGASLGLGDVMYDFSVTNAAGETITLSEVLKEKKMVLLNFFYTTCGPCVNEFPYMEEAYQQYQDKVGIIAVDPLDDNSTVATFQESMGLSFSMAACQPAWSSTFSVTGYPTSIVIDRYGVICLIEVGGLTSIRPFTSMFEHFTSDNYEQKLYNSLNDLITNVKPTFTMPSSDELGEVINKGEINVTYRPEADDEYAWPFIIGEKNGDACIYASNQNIEGSYSILYADVELKAGQAVGFDYLVSSENGADILHVIVNDEPIYTISGVSEKEEWKGAYPWVASQDGTYEVALCYIKDESNDAGDDTVYIKNMRVVDAGVIDVETYIPQYAASSEDGFEYNYVDIVYNEKDNYYHVGSANGPLLLVDMMGYTDFNEEKTLWDLAYEGTITLDGHNYYEDLVQYFSYASNSSLSGVCTVNKGLAELLMIVDQVAGFEEDDKHEWLKLCKYYQVYGADGVQLEDPIKGLATFSAYEAKEGVGIESNHFHYTTAIIPRGKLAKFVPSKSGVYRITSRNESTQGVDGWIFNGNREILLTYEQNERLYNDSHNVSMLYYMEKGEAYYIDIAFWDVYEAGYIYYDIEYVAPEYDVFRLASPGYYTYDTDANGEEMYNTIPGGTKAVLGSDGYYYADLGDGKVGNMLYADFTGITSLFSNPIATVNAYDENGNPVLDENGNPVKVKGMIEMGGFDFSKTDEDMYVLSIMEKYDNDIEKTKEYLKAQWGDEYDANAELYKLDDVLAGRYHGKGEDLTDDISAYLSKMYSGSDKARVGCVPVDERLAEILQELMYKYVFDTVDDSWPKLCYFYEHLGPQD